MISYSFPEEKAIISFFAEKIGDLTINSILESESTLTKDDAKKICRFYWKMVDFAVELEKYEECPWPEGYEFWSEKILQSFIAHIKQSGHEDVWRKF